MSHIISPFGAGSRLGLGNCLWLCLFGILTLISVQSPILEITEQSLADHMVIEHTIFFFLGAASVKTAEITLRILVSHAYNRRKSSSQAITSIKKTTTTVVEQGCNDHNSINDENNNLKLLTTTTLMIRFWSNIVRKIFSLSSKYSFLWLLIPIILLTIWHWPPLFDYAVLHENIHILQHISFIIVGAMGFIALRTLGESFKIIILITLNAIMAFTGLLFSVTTDPVYSFYSINGHNEAGTYMLITCILLLLIALPAYLIHRTLFHIRIGIKQKNISDGNNT
jgi:cytochrome c oxidase assembly factor CtaG